MRSRQGDGCTFVDQLVDLVNWLGHILVNLVNFWLTN